MPSDVFVRETTDRKDFVQSVLMKLEGQMKGRHVFVKPNLESYEPYPTTTHPDTLDAVLKFLTERDITVEVGDAPSSEAGEHGKVIENHPLNQVCAKYEVELVDLHSFDFYKYKTKSGYRIRISEIPYEANYIISLPVLKSHPKTVMAGAVKNLYGLLQERERRMMHIGIKSMDRGIAEVHQAFRPNINIMDAVEVLVSSNEIRQGGQRKRLGYMLAGEDALAMDSLGLSLLQKVDPALKGKAPLDIKHLSWMKRLGLGTEEYKRVRI